MRAPSIKQRDQGMGRVVLVAVDIVLIVCRLTGQYAIGTGRASGKGTLQCPDG